MKLRDIILEAVVNLNEDKKLTPDEFIKRAQSMPVHQNPDGTPKYTYDNVDYKGTDKKVLITCPIHGDFPQSPNSHLAGNGCRKCYDDKKSNVTDFIKKAQQVHQNPDGTPKYTYDNVDYIDNKKTKVQITCPIHGDFPQSPSSHLSGSGCDKCYKDRLKSFANDFIKKAQQVHQNPDGSPKYTYDNTNYVSSRLDVMITCPIHGDFPQPPKRHLQGAGCPDCNESKGEKEIKRILYEKNIKYIPFKKYDDCISHRSKTGVSKKCAKLIFDFYLPDFNTLVEFDGKYHFSGKVYSNQDYIGSVLNDREKNKYTKLNGIKLIRIGYHDMKKIEDELMKGLNFKGQLYLSTNYQNNKGWRELTIGQNKQKVSESTINKYVITESQLKTLMKKNF
jgi:hypothetical protein